jgi:hypothetical protein
MPKQSLYLELTARVLAFNTMIDKRGTTDRCADLLSLCPALATKD